MKKVLLFIAISFLVACSHPYSEMKEGYYAGSYQSYNFGYVTNYVYIQESKNGSTREIRYKVPDSVYWQLHDKSWGTYVKITH